MLTEPFEEAKNAETPVMVHRIVDNIDEIVRAVRFDGWQATHAGEREVKKVLCARPYLNTSCTRPLSCLSELTATWEYY